MPRPHQPLCDCHFFSRGEVATRSQVMCIKCTIDVVALCRECQASILVSFHRLSTNVACLVELILYLPVNNFSVMSGRFPVCLFFFVFFVLFFFLGGEGHEPVLIKQTLYSRSSNQMHVSSFGNDKSSAPVRLSSPFAGESIVSLESVYCTHLARARSPLLQSPRFQISQVL